MTDDRNPIADDALDSLSVAPAEPEENDHIHHPRQNAGQDASLAERLERNPESTEARLDTALDESMDASDPPSTTQPLGNDPAPSSGYDPDAEAALSGRR